MFKLKIVICDDDQHKIEALTGQFNESDFDIVSCNNKYDLENILSSCNYQKDAIFLDLRFRESSGISYSLKYEDIVSLKNKVGKKCKIFIYTQYTDEHIELLRKLAFQEIIADWIDFEKVRQPTSFKSSILRIERALGYKREANQGVWILHLSDLHFGKQFQFAGKDVGTYLADMIIEQFKGCCSNTSLIPIQLPNLIIVSGDLSNSGDSIEMNEAKKFLGYLGQGLLNLKPSMPAIPIIVPGNHDFNWQLSLVDEYHVECIGKEIKIVEKHNEKFANIKWVPFLEAYDSVLSSTHKSCEGPLWWYYDFRGRLDLSIIALNSAYPLTYKNKTPVVSRDTLDDISSRYSSSSQNSLGIVVVHHPFDTWGEESVRDDLLKIMYNKLSVRVILSGHKHKSRLIQHKVGPSKHVVEAQTGSPSASFEAIGPGVLPNYRVINVEKGFNGEWCNVKSWTFQYQDGEFKPATVDAAGNFVDKESFQM